MIHGLSSRWTFYQGPIIFPSSTGEGYPFALAAQAVYPSTQ